MDQTYADFRSRREATVWQRLNRTLRVLLVLAIWLVIVSLFVPPYKKLTQSRAEIDNLQQQVNEQQNLLAHQTRPRAPRNQNLATRTDKGHALCDSLGIELFFAHAN